MLLHSYKRHTLQSDSKIKCKPDHNTEINEVLDKKIKNPLKSTAVFFE